MAFDVGGGAYQQFMGVWSDRLAAPFADLAGVRAGMRVLDVGCGPGALTSVLVERLGAGAVQGVDPSASFVAAVRERLPGVEVEQAPAEALPFPDASFDVAFAQLVVHFMTDPAAGIGEMRRVTSAGGLVAACVWDFGTGRGPVSLFWSAAMAVDPSAHDESDLAGARPGDLKVLLEGAGLDAVTESELNVTREYASFEDWWEPYTLGVGPAGDYVKHLDGPGLERLRGECRSRLPVGSFSLDATAWCARGTVPG